MQCSLLQIQQKKEGQAHHRPVTEPVWNPHIDMFSSIAQACYEQEHGTLNLQWTRNYSLQFHQQWETNTLSVVLLYISKEQKLSTCRQTSECICTMANWISCMVITMKFRSYIYITCRYCTCVLDETLTPVISYYHLHNLDSHKHTPYTKLAICTVLSNSIIYL